MLNLHVYFSVYAQYVVMVVITDYSHIIAECCKLDFHLSLQCKVKF